VAAVLDAKTAVRANARACRVRAAKRLRNPTPGVAQDSPVERRAHVISISACHVDPIERQTGLADESRLHRARAQIIVWRADAVSTKGT